MPDLPRESTSALDRTKQAATVAAEQTTCPVLGGPIDKNLFTEYKGKKVYFCCAECKQKFEQDPQKYVSKLPQFAK
jgi:YHS domain-containing protein